MNDFVMNIMICHGERMTMDRIIEWYAFIELYYMIIFMWF